MEKIEKNNFSLVHPQKIAIDSKRCSKIPPGRPRSISTILFQNFKLLLEIVVKKLKKKTNYDEDSLSFEKLKVSACSAVSGCSRFVL